MQPVARELNLSEMAFLVQQADELALRWFTPTLEGCTAWGTRETFLPDTNSTVGTCGTCPGRTALPQRNAEKVHFVYAHA